MGLIKKLRRKKKKLDENSMELGPDACPTYDSRLVMYRGKIYRIPTDSGGFVPTWALLSRFQDEVAPEQRNRDLWTDSRKVLSMRLTPEQAAEWWADPTSCDIEGLDTESSRVYDISFTKDPVQKNLQKRIAVITPTKNEQKRIRREISKAFTVEELNEMTEGKSLIIQTVPNGGDAAGVYVRKQNDVRVPIIIYEEGISADSIVHEAVHHSRTMRSRRGKDIAESTFPTKRDGTVDLMAIAFMSSEDRNRMQNVEEAATVAETIVRTKKDPTPSGYYEDVRSPKSVERMYDEDRKILKGQSHNARVIGDKAVSKVIEEFEATNIAEAMIMSRESAKVSAKKLYTGKTKKK